MITFTTLGYNLFKDIPTSIKYKIEKTDKKTGTFPKKNAHIHLIFYPLEKKIFITNANLLSYEL